MIAGADRRSPAAGWPAAAAGLLATLAAVCLVHGVATASAAPALASNAPARSSPRTHPTSVASTPRSSPRTTEAPDAEGPTGGAGAAGVAGAGATGVGGVGATGLSGESASDPSAQATSLPGPGPLVTNGLGSPSCDGGAAEVELSATARANCAASGVVAVPAPIDNYQFDIHIDTGLDNGLTTSATNSMAAIVQDYLLTPLWMALVWLTDVLVVALEWCYSISLLGPGTFGPIAGGLETMHRALTTPWLATVLAIAAVTFLYNGLIRRRVVETLGQFALMLAMMIGGLWIIVDPVTTVGAVSQLANQASLGVLAATATGDPNQPVHGLGGGLDQIFATAVGTPWCYMEFGNVGWCDEPSQLDPALRKTALEITALGRSGAGQLAGGEARQQAASVAAAQTNGALFLAFPANGPGRNSINANILNPSLYNVLCGSFEATACVTATASEAEFRTQQGTFARIGGLLLITIGELGMFGFLGFIALRLLSAALLSVLYLLLAPIAVLAPALGDGGRALFRLWSLRLLGSVLAKLVYSVFLGVTLLILGVLGDLGSLGWWTQWLLIASFWWIVFNHRHQLLEHVIHERGESSRRASLGSRLFAAHQAMRLARPVVKPVAEGAGRLIKAAVDAGRHGPKRPPIPRPPKTPPGADRRVELADQVARTLEREHAQAVSTLAAEPARQAELAALRERRGRLDQEHHKATLDEDPRRTASLARRRADVAAQIAAREQELSTARATVRRGAENTRQTGVVHDAEQRARHAEMLDREAELRPLLAPPGDKRRGRRDYAELAPLADVRRTDYDGLPAPQRRLAQLEIDRALERRRTWRRETRIGDAERAIAERKGKTKLANSSDRPKPVRVDRRRRQFLVADELTRDRPDAGRARRPRPADRGPGQGEPRRWPGLRDRGPQAPGPSTADPARPSRDPARPPREGDRPPRDRDRPSRRSRRVP